MDIIKTLRTLREGLKAKEDTKETLVRKFDEILRQQPEISDEEMCFLLYGHYNKTSEYRVIKHRYEQKLQDEVVSYCGAQSYLDNYTFRNLVAEKNFLIIMALYKNGFQDVAIKLVEKNYTFCKENQFTHLSIQLNEILVNYYGFIVPNKTKFNVFMEEGIQLNNLLMAESYLKRYNAKASQWYVLQKGGLTALQKEEFEKMVTHSQELYKLHFSRSTFLNYYNIAHFFYVVTGQIQKSLEQSLEAAAIQKKHFPTDRLIQYSIGINIGLSYFRLHQYHKAVTQYRNTLLIPSEGHRYWMEESLHYFTTLLRTEDYKTMFEVYRSRFFHKNITKFQPIHEQWKVREAYIHLLIESKWLPKYSIPQDYMHKFSISKFLNSVPLYTKDKAGLFVTILTIKIAFTLLQKKYDTLENIYENLAQYAHKHLKRKDSIRSYYFIKIMGTLAKGKYHPYFVNIYAQPYLEKLNSEVYFPENYQHTIELIPYDILWNIIVHILEINNKKKSRP